MQLFFVSSNRHKIREFQEIFSLLGKNFSLLTLLDHPEWEKAVAETGTTYQENALLKAQAYRQLTDLPIIADDSGVEVAAFPGLLGVNSARWFPGSDHDRAFALLEKLKNQTNREITYHCTICLLMPEKNQPRFFSGQVKATVTDKPSTNSGFGYDPIVIPIGYDQTFSELGDDIKNKFSHRRQAIEKLLAYLDKN